MPFVGLRLVKRRILQAKLSLTINQSIKTASETVQLVAETLEHRSPDVAKTARPDLTKRYGDYPHRLNPTEINFDKGAAVGVVDEQYLIHYCFFYHIPNPRCDDIHP